MTDTKDCPVCSRLPSKVFDSEQIAIVTMFINQKSGNKALIIAKEDGKVCIDVAFCPWCGRDLRRADDD